MKTIPVEEVEVMKEGGDSSSQVKTKAKVCEVFVHPTYPTRCFELGWAVPYSDFLSQGIQVRF